MNPNTLSPVDTAPPAGTKLKRSAQSGVLHERRQFQIQGRALEVQVFYPDTDQPAPGILYLHDIFGVLKVFEEDARELARLGYVVYLPNLFSGQAIRYCIRTLVTSSARNNAKDSPLLAEIAELLDLLKAEPTCNARLGVLGQCLTGGFVIQSALRSDVDAPVIYHHSFGQQGAGIPPKEQGSLQSIETIQGHWSSLPDPFCPAKRRDKLKYLLGDRLDDHTYPIPHGFRSSSRSTDSAQLAWKRTLEFFDEQLKPTS